jgi:hypothetical protein
VPGRCHSAGRRRWRPPAARTAALFQLAADLPAAILARTLGIHIDVAVDWQRARAGDWATYAADVSRRTRPAGSGEHLSQAHSG